MVSRLDHLWTGVSVRRLVQPGGRGSRADPALVDRSGLTDHQREVLATAHEVGHFQCPKGTNAEAALDTGPLTFAAHVAAAQENLLAAVLS